MKPQQYIVGRNRSVPVGCCTAQKTWPLRANWRFEGTSLYAIT